MPAPAPDSEGRAWAAAGASGLLGAPRCFQRQQHLGTPGFGLVTEGTVQDETRLRLQGRGYNLGTWEQALLVPLVHPLCWPSTQ